MSYVFHCKKASLKKKKTPWYLLFNLSSPQGHKMKGVAIKVASQPLTEENHRNLQMGEAHKLSAEFFQRATGLAPRPPPAPRRLLTCLPGSTDRRVHCSLPETPQTTSTRLGDDASLRRVVNPRKKCFRKGEKAVV